jgi:hypothetical protein
MQEEYGLQVLAQGEEATYELVIELLSVARRAADCECEVLYSFTGFPGTESLHGPNTMSCGLKFCLLRTSHRPGS